MEAKRTIISLDTNVLLRYILLDDEDQSPIAEDLIDNLSQVRQAYVGREVILELAWVLSTRYKFDRNQIARVITNLVDATEFVVEDSSSIADAISQYVQSSYDPADLLILATAKRFAALPLYTFDRQLSQHEDVVLLN